MGKWEMVRLGDAATFINGFAFKPADWTSEGLPIIRIQNLTGSSDVINYYNKPHGTQYEVNNSDILISWSASLGVYEWSNGKALLNQHIFKVVFDKLNYDKRFFMYVIDQKLNEMSAVTHGSTMKHITKKFFDAILIPYPPLSVQQQIADVLDRASALIEKRKAQIEKLDLLIKSQFIEMFGDPITNEKQWPTHQLSEITSSRLGKMLDGKKQTGKYLFPYLANFNVQWFRFDLSELNEMDFDDTEQQEFNLKKGDLLVCEGGEVGRCAIWDEEKEHCFFQKALHRVRCNTKIILPEYLALWFYLRSQYNKFEDIVGKATIAHLPGVKLKQIKVIVPQIALQNQFASFVQKVESQKAKLQQSLEKQELNYKSLMQKCFQGEIF